jgi:hypothetical protein
VWALDSELDKVDLLVNEIGSYNGARLVNVDAFFWDDPMRYLDVTASGTWTANVMSMNYARLLKTSRSGTTDDVIRVTKGGIGGDPVVDGGFVVPVGRSRSGHSVESVPRSTRMRTEAHSQHRTRTRTSRKQFHGERPEHSPSATTATDTSRDPKYERFTPVEVAVARTHPQITHALAPSCPVCTSAHRRWR